MDLTVGLLLGSRFAAASSELAGQLPGEVVVSLAAEGESAGDTLSRVRSVCESGAGILLVVDEAVSLRPDMAPPEFPYCLISDHLNLTGANPLVGPNAAEWGPRFQDLTDAWNPELRAILRDTAREAGLDLPEGVVAGIAGRFHTTAEAAMLRGLGADVVSHGFVAEAITGRHAGRRMAGLAVTSGADGVEPAELSGLLAPLIAALA